MEWLGGWLKQLILIILIAGFLDLLLPTNALQRYVKTVISLFLLMVLLSPVFQLFQHKWNEGELLAAAAGKQAAAEAGGKMQSLQEIMRRAGAIQAADRREAQRLAETQLAAAMKTGIEQQLGRRAEQVAVRTAVDDQGSLAVTAVNVIPSRTDGVPEAAAGSGSELVTPVKPFKPIKPVIIDSEPVGAFASKNEQSAEAAAPDRGERDEVIRYLTREWQLTPKQITVTAQ